MAEPRFDVTTIGEMMLRLSVPAGQRLETAQQLDLVPGGAEGNVVAVLSRLRRNCAWVGSLPRNPLGRLVANHLRSAEVDLTGVIWCETGRIGTYYVEFGLSPRPTQVIYDRAGSCAACLQPAQIDWSYLLSTRLVHMTGITPALSPCCRDLTGTVMERCREANIPISFDVNYRAGLWSHSEARSVLTPLIQGVELLVCSQSDAARIFGIAGTPEEVVGSMAAISRARNVVVTFGEGDIIGWNGEQLHRQPALPVQIVDRLGAGDALTAGVIYGWLDDDLPRGLRYGAILAALALSQRGDAVVTTPDELVAIDASGDQRLIR